MTFNTYNSEVTLGNNDYSWVKFPCLLFFFFFLIKQPSLSGDLYQQLKLTLIEAVSVRSSPNSTLLSNMKLMKEWCIIWDLNLKLLCFWRDKWFWEVPKLSLYNLTYRQLPLKFFLGKIVEPIVKIFHVIHMLIQSFNLYNSTNVSPKLRMKKLKFKEM